MGDERKKSMQVHSTPLLRDRILMEQVRQVYVLAPLGFMGTILNAALVFIVMRDVVREPWLVGWLAAVVAVLLLRTGLVLWYRSGPQQPETATAWRKRFVAGLAATGIIWGSIGLYPFSNSSPVYQVFLAFVLGGMAAGASAMYAAIRHAYLAFSIPALVPLTIHYFLYPEGFHWAMGAMLCLFGTLLWRVAAYNHAVNDASLRLRFENQEMIESLRVAKNDVEGLNADLVKEIEAKLTAEAELRAYQSHLEKVVEERTADLVMANQQLSAAKNAAEAASAAKSEFLTNMSHEMRTPLAGTLGMIKLVLDMKIGDEERELLGMASRGAESLLRIIADVLDFSRVEAGVMAFEYHRFSLAEVVRTAVEVVSFAAQEKGLDLSWKVAESVPQQVWGDPGRLRQVLVNLLGNAVKFTEQGQIEVFVALEDGAGVPDAAFIRFSIRDTGLGIPADHLDTIFGRFTQVDSSITRRYGGTGLGLALTRQIVEAMGGRIWAESSMGAGSTFHFTIPLNKEKTAGVEDA